MEISSVCDLSRDLDLLLEVGRGTVVRPLVAVCRLSNDADLSRERADSVLRREEFLSAEWLCELHGAPKNKHEFYPQTALNITHFLIQNYIYLQGTLKQFSEELLLAPSVTHIGISRHQT